MLSPRRPKATNLATTRMGITDTEPTPWVGVVLAGGRSSRMGRDKARLAWRDQSLLAHACATLQAAGACKVVVSGDYPEYAGIPDAVPALGPMPMVPVVSVRRLPREHDAAQSPGPLRSWHRPTSHPASLLLI